MSRIFIALLGFFLAGCVVTPPQHDETSSLAISSAGWQVLHSHLENAPLLARQSLLNLERDRVQVSVEAESGNAEKVPDAQRVLFEILMLGRNPILSSDTTFESVQTIVTGDSPPAQKTFAAALAAYLIQPDFACRQPIYTRYFRQRYGVTDADEVCEEDVPFAVKTHYDGVKIIWVNPMRVKSIHLLFAANSDRIASRFGHVALRLVICPQGKSMAADCDANLSEHLVLGFMANIDDLSLDTFKALQGKYKAYLFASPFMDTYRGYAIDEFRDIYSLPLRLTDVQRELMVRELADIHWRYTGEYHFFTRNCATLMQDALRSTWPELAASKAMGSTFLRPDSWFEAFKFSELAEGNKLSDLEAAERDGFYFSNTKIFYEQALNFVRNKMPSSAFKDLVSYLEIDPVDRRKMINEPVYASALKGDSHLFGAQLLLEEYAVLRSERQMAIDGAKYFLQQDFLSRKDEIRAQLDDEHVAVFEKCLLAPLQQRYNPLRNASGIPGKADNIEISQIQSASCQSIKNEKQLREAIEKINDKNSEQWQRFNKIAQYWIDSVGNVMALKNFRSQGQLSKTP